jgi:hypothetical protein
MDLPQLQDRPTLAHSKAGVTKEAAVVEGLQFNREVAMQAAAAEGAAAEGSISNTIRLLATGVSLHCLRMLVRVTQAAAEYHALSVHHVICAFVTNY